MSSPVFDVEFTDKQSVAIRSPATEILYGGAAAGGKSFFMRAFSIILCGLIGGLNVYLFRRIREDLVKNHMEGTRGFPVLLAPLIISGHVKIVEDEIRFWNGSKIFLCHCKDEKDRFKYLGAEIHVLLIDELTMFSEVIYRFLRGRLRAPGLQFPQWALDFFLDKFGVNLPAKIPLALCSSNPGNIGHGWVKAAWKPGLEDYKIRKMSPEDGGMLRQYIPARLEDNPHVASDYEDKLAGLGTKELVRAMRNGDWDVVAGAFFDNIRQEKHMLPPFSPPKHWTRFRSFDWGSAKPFSVGWWVIAEHEWVDGFLDGKERIFPKGALIRYREWYGCKKDENGDSIPDSGLRLSPEAVAKGIKERERGETIDEMQSVADPAIWREDGGPSHADRMLRYIPGKVEGPRFRAADNTRVSGAGHALGWQQVYMRLAWEDVDDGEPMLYVTSDCQDWWRTVPALQHDEHRPEDVDSAMEDHAGDDTRYACATRPISRVPKPRVISGPKPWTMDWIEANSTRA